MAPTHFGVVVGAALPPAGSSVMASALVLPLVSGGLETRITKFPLESGRTVMDGIGLLPGAFGINHNCRTRSPDGMGTFCPVRTMPYLACHIATIWGA